VGFGKLTVWPMTTLTLGDHELVLSHLAQLLTDEPPRLQLSTAVRDRVLASRALVEAAMAEGRVCYGINTGFGKLAGVVIPPADLDALQVNLVRSHAAGVGPTLDRSICRLAFALRLTNMSWGHSGVRLELLERGLQVFNAGIVPVLPSQGSVGASGDLAPLAHMALVLIGEGRAWLGDEIMDGAAALQAAGLEPIRLQCKEGLSLLNGTQMSTATLADAMLQARRLARVADIAVACSVEAYKGTDTSFDPRIHELRRQPGQQAVAANVLRVLAGSEILPSHKNCSRVQDSYSMRCAPQVHGASVDTLAHVEQVVLREVNAVTDNPLVFEGGDILSGGNFHAQPVALAADFLKVAVSELASISERRIENLVNPDLSGLPPFLAPGSGLNSGLMIAHVTAAALVSENKVLAHPASVDSIPTSAGKEDHVSMAAHAARQARQVVDNATYVLAIELMAAFHGLALERELKAGAGVEAVREVLNDVLSPLDQDHVLSGEIEAVARLIRDGTLLEAVESRVGALH
jgi:histidine ammonia-lyase